MKTSLLDRLRAEAKKLKEDAATRGNFEKVDWFYAAAGDNLLRILPHPKSKDEFFFKEVRLHFMPFKKNNGSMVQVPVRCLYDFDEKCPLCLAFEKVVRTDKEKAQGFRVTTRYLYNVINYTERKVQPYAAPKTVHEEVMGWLGEFNSDVSNVDTGRDFKISKKTVSGRTSYSVKPSMKESAVPEKLRPLLNNCVDFDELYKSNEKAKMMEFLGASGALKKAAKDEEEEPEVDVEEDDVPFAPPPRKKVAPKAEEEDEPVFEEEEEEEKEEEEKEVVKKSAAKVKKSLAKIKEEEDEVSEDDDELSKELRDLGVL